MTPKLSIIVPIYNVEPYLRRCLDSILAQTFTDFEAILVDDGSPDRCGEIIDEYARKDPRFIAIHQGNNGVSTARNAGLRIARGEYVGLVDPDDWIEPDTYESLIAGMEDKQCDLSICAWINDYEDGTVKEHSNLLPPQVISKEETVRHLFDMPPTIAGSVCNKLFRRELILKPFDSHYRICEDNLFLAEYLCNIRQSSISDKVLYHVFSRTDSATRKNPDKIAEGLPARRAIIETVSAISAECRMLAEHVYLDQCLTYCSSSRDHGTPYYKLARDELLGYCKKHFPMILRNTKMTLKAKMNLLKEYIRIRAEKSNR